MCGLVERRYNPRIPAHLPLQLTLLEGGGELTGTLLDVSESGLSAQVPMGAGEGALVKLEILGLLFFGHVAYCKRENAEFRIGIFVEPALLDSSNLTELLEAYAVDHAG